MIKISDVQFGRLTPPPEKRAAHADRYRYGNMIYFPLVTASMEKTWPLPDLRAHYNQGHSNACTGFAASWMSSIHNFIPFDATWLYHRGQDTDKDPNTTPERDNGGYVYSVLDILRNEGHKEIGATAPDIDAGILSYGWIHTVDELRTAFAAGPVVFGLPWYQEFMTPRTVSGEHWIGTRSNWAVVRRSCHLWIPVQRPAPGGKAGQQLGQRIPGCLDWVRFHHAIVWRMGRVRSAD